MFRYVKSIGIVGGKITFNITLTLQWHICNILQGRDNHVLQKLPHGCDNLVETITANQIAPTRLRQPCRKKYKVVSRL